MPPKKKLPKFFNNRLQDIKYLDTENHEFKDIFKKVCDYIGYDTTTDSYNLQQTALQFLGPKKFVGVYPYDIMKPLKNGQSAIINTDEHTKEGMHWTAIYRKSKLKYYFFDSYGRDWKTVIPNLKHFVLGMDCDISNPIHVRQFGDQSCCGQMSLSFLIYMYAQPKPEMALVI